MNNRSSEVANELQRIAAKNGGILRATDVVTEATNLASPLHACFEWDDGEAGHLYRLHQARMLIRVTVQTVTYNEQHYRVRAYVSLPDDRVVEGGGYRVLANILSSPSGRGQLLEQALKELNSVKVKYYQLTELAGIFAAIERASQTNDKGSDVLPPPQSSSENEATTSE